MGKMTPAAQARNSGERVRKSIPVAIQQNSVIAIAAEGTPEKLSDILKMCRMILKADTSYQIEVRINELNEGDCHAVR